MQHWCDRKPLSMYFKISISKKLSVSTKVSTFLFSYELITTKLQYRKRKVTNY